MDEQEVTTGEVGQKKATISFVNTYNDEPVELGGEGSVKINATKTLANRPLTDGEFTFRIFDKKEIRLSAKTPRRQVRTRRTEALRLLR